MTPRVLHQLMIAVALTFLISCGGSGNTMAGSGGAPYIAAELDSMPDDSSAAEVHVLNNSNGEPIMYAVVMVNGELLTYNTEKQAYQGSISAAPGDSVTVNVAIDGVSYTATGEQFRSYPVITKPVSGDTWSMRCFNTITWSSPQQADAFTALGVIDSATEELVWPAAGTVELLPITQTSFHLYGNKVKAGEEIVIVGIAKKLDFPDAAPGSVFIIAGFSYAPVTVSDIYPPPVSIEISPATSGIALGTSQQFRAAGTYCDSSKQDITATVTWASSDSSVATISNAGSVGSATAVSGGATTITATLGEISSSVTLTVHHYFALPLISRYVWPQAVAIGDVTGDGRNDVVVITGDSTDSSNSYKLMLFAQNSSGGLSSPIAYPTTGTSVYPPYSVATGDINNDGKNEVVVGNSEKNIEVFVQDGQGGLVSNATYETVNSTQVRIADLNHDGRPDVVGIGWATNTAHVFLQNGSGTLDTPAAYAVDLAGWNDLEVGDVNNDGLIDIIVMSGQGLHPQIGVLEQRVDGTFGAAEYYDLGGGGGIGVGDINGDGLNDIVESLGDMCVLTQNANGTLAPQVCLPSYRSGGPIEVGDVNNDGRKDIVVVQYAWSELGITLQAADGTLLPQEMYTIPYGVDNRHALAIGDINSDGTNDIVTLDRTDGLIVLYR